MPTLDRRAVPLRHLTSRSVKRNASLWLARLCRLAKWLAPSRTSLLSRGSLPGVVVVLLFCFGLLLLAFRASDRYYEKRLVATDTSYYLMSASLVVSGKDDFRFGRVLNHPAPFPTSDGGTGVYVLQTLAAWCLRHHLPLRPAMAVVLNGIWFVAMAVSFYALLWSRIGKWAPSAIVTIAYLVANPFLPTVQYGITSMDPNLVGFMLGTSALCWTVLSDRFQRVVPCLLAGTFLGFLCLGRVYTLGVVAPAMLPYVLSCFWRRSWRDVVASTLGGLIALGAACVIAGWFVRAHWQALLAYPTQYGSAGVLSHTAFSDGMWQWLRFPKSALAENLTLACVLTWPLAASLLGREGRFRDFNFSALWAALVPLAVLSKMGTTFQPYGAACLFGVFVVLLFPFGKSAVATLHRGRYAAVLTMACAFSCWAFLGRLHADHSPAKDNKRSTIAALETMRQDAASTGRKSVTLALVHWGVLHDAALIDALVMDLGLRVATPHFRPKARPTNPLIITPLMTDPWAWDATVVGANAVTPTTWAQRVIQEADYVLVLAGSRKQDRREGRWPPWVEASDLISNSGVFRRLGSPFHVIKDGPVELLVRRQPRAG